MTPEPVVPILMPQMGESVVEGTIVRWLKRVGDHVDKDDPLLEISTDKVNAEIPSPGAGVLLEIRVEEGATVPVHTIVAVIGEKARAGTTGTDGTTGTAGTPSSAGSAVGGGSIVPSVPVVPLVPVVPAPSSFTSPRARSFASPVVRRLAKEHGVDISHIDGTGASGRVTRRDVDAYVAKGGGRKPPAPHRIEFAADAATRVEKMSIMRRKIADHMVASVKTSAHVYSAYEVDFSEIDRLRRAHRSRYEAAGASLTYTAFITNAVARTIGDFPYVNASLDGDNIVYKRDINIGIAVALEQGLIVPVIRNADRLSMLEICRAVQDLAHRARSKQLRHEEVGAGTFTVTNPGVFGGLWGLPIISQPQVAILAVGSIDKRVVVVDDEMTIRPMCYLTLGYDHRLVDGADGGRFLQSLKSRLEDFDESLM
jgi:pyruvate dehydrogenase E2 component (dihydrolipoamide acetyltransferase)